MKFIVVSLLFQNMIW